MIQSGLRSFALWLGCILGLQQIFQFGHELSDILEIEIDGSEAHVGDFVVAAETVHDELANLTGLALAFGGFDDEGFGLIHNLLELADGDRTLFAGAHQAVEDFLAVEALAASVFFDNHVRDFVDPLVGGEALLALEALAAAADGIGFLALARVDYFVVFKAAKRALHGDLNLSTRHCSSWAAANILPNDRATRSVVYSCDVFSNRTLETASSEHKRDWNLPPCMYSTPSTVIL